jgi:hypothetical protein
MAQKKISLSSRLSLSIFEWFTVILHWIGLGHLYVGFSTWFKSGTRKLTVTEIALAQTVYHNAIDYQLVRIDEDAKIATRQWGIAYVALNLIHCHGSLHPVHFIHEMMHIWQYQHVGVRYIPRALWAQHFGGGYNYGGLAALEKAIENKHTILDFNYEQQAEIMADYFCLLQGYQPKYVTFDASLVPVFQIIVKPIYTAP